MNIEYRSGKSTDLESILDMLPRLAAFELPEKRSERELWQGDADLLRSWANGEAPECYVRVASEANGTIRGACVLSLREELLSHQPSAHLEVLVVDESAEGRGIARELLRQTEELARQKGALSITLHVFANNVRARNLYEKTGFNGELMRYIRHLE